MSATARDPRLLLEARGLEIDRPDGAPLLREVEIELREGEIIALLGGSGAGKSTLVTALHQREVLEAAGFAVRAQVLERHAGVGLVPQRGALFDHLDVAGNLALAMRNAYPPRQVSAGALQDSLASVDLPTTWAIPMPTSSCAMPSTSSGACSSSGWPSWRWSPWSVC